MMARTNQRFPSYDKIGIDPDDVPEDFWTIGSRRCISCGVRWPNNHYFVWCPDCNKGTRKVDSAPDMSWREAVSHLLRARFESLYEEWNENISDDQIAWVAPPVQYTEKEFAEGMRDIEDFLEGLSARPVAISE